jgi:hypothetical protein
VRASDNEKKKFLVGMVMDCNSVIVQLVPQWGQEVLSLALV